MSYYLVGQQTMNFEQQHIIEPQVISGLDSIAQQLHHKPAKLYLLHGHSSVFTAGLMIGSAVHQPIAVIDAAVRFSSYMLSRIASALGIQPRTLQRRTYVSRSFTAFQTEAVITQKLPRFLKTTPCPIVIILGLLDTYYDKQVKPHECKQSLQRIMLKLKKLTIDGTHVLIADVEVSTSPIGKEGLFHIVQNAADVELILQPNEFGIQLHEKRRKQLWDGTTKPLHLLSTNREKVGVNSVER